MTGTFKEKFDKVYQSYKNICEQKISEDSMFDANKETYIRFFQDCFHLKDWLKNDETIQSKRAKGNIEIYINNSNHLKFTADIANASKHKKIDFKIRVDKEIDVAESGYVMHGDINLNEFGRKVRIIYNGHNSIDAFNLARGCIDEWQTFIKKYKLFK